MSMRDERVELLEMFLDAFSWRRETWLQEIYEVISHNVFVSMCGVYITSTKMCQGSGQESKIKN